MFEGLRVIGNLSIGHNNFISFKCKNILIHSFLFWYFEYPRLQISVKTHELIRINILFIYHSTTFKRATFGNYGSLRSISITQTIMFPQFSTIICKIIHKWKPSSCQSPRKKWLQKQELSSISLCSSMIPSNIISI